MEILSYTSGIIAITIVILNTDVKLFLRIKHLLRKRFLMFEVHEYDSAFYDCGLNLRERRRAQ